MVDSTENKKNSFRLKTWKNKSTKLPQNFTSSYHKIRARLIRLLKKYL